MDNGHFRVKRYLEIVLGAGLLLPALLWAKQWPEKHSVPQPYEMKAVQQVAHRQNPWRFRSGENGFVQYADKNDKKSHHRNFEDLTPEERERIIKRRQRFESLPNGKKEEIRRARERYKELPPQKRQALKERWDKMSPEEKKAYLRKMEQQRK